MSELKKRIKAKLVSVSYMFRETVEFPALKVTLYSTSLCTSVTLKKKKVKPNSQQQNTYKNEIQEGTERSRKTGKEVRRVWIEERGRGEGGGRKREKKKERRRGRG